MWQLFNMPVPYIRSQRVAGRFPKVQVRLPPVADLSTALNSKSRVPQLINRIPEPLSFRA